MSRVIAIAEKEIGTKEEPAGSNNVKYNTWFYKKSVSGARYPWCGCFVSWCYFKAGLPLPPIDYSKGFAGTNYAVENVHKWGRIITDRKQLHVDDIVFFDWDGNKRYDHTGIFEKDNGDGFTFTTIEGNTAVGNDSNGGCVMRRVRNYSQALFIRPNVAETLA